MKIAKFERMQDIEFAQDCRRLSRRASKNKGAGEKMKG